MPSNRFTLPNRMVELTVDLAALQYNFRQLRQYCGQKVKILAVIKADAYGHGLLPVAQVLAPAGADYFGVAYCSEGVSLRQAGITLPILLLMGVLPEEAAEAVAHNLEVTLFCREMAAALAAQARQQSKKVKVHVKIDTGMGRLGLLPTELMPFLESLGEFPELELAGLISHFAASDCCDRSYTHQQLADFERLLKGVRGRGWAVPASHIANSAAVLHVHQAHLNMVRAGITLYGSPPSLETPSPIPLKPVMSLRTRVLQLQELPPGCSISYGRTYFTDKPSLIAALPVGYCNGYSRLMSNRGCVLLHGQRAPIRGRVCMNLTMVDVTEIPGVKKGDMATLLGEDGSDRLTGDDLAAWAETISYEIYCMMGNSNYRRFIGN
ncbi:MAG TPA: alanine racemase [Desulfobacterales bacterium]|nr:alanine racemase [Desulfobacterales bacterium]